MFYHCWIFWNFSRATSVLLEKSQEHLRVSHSFLKQGMESDPRPKVSLLPLNKYLFSETSCKERPLQIFRSHWFFGYPKMDESLGKNYYIFKNAFTYTKYNCSLEAKLISKWKMKMWKGFLLIYSNSCLIHQIA